MAGEKSSPAALTGTGGANTGGNTAGPISANQLEISSFNNIKIKEIHKNSEIDSTSVKTGDF